MYWVMSLAGALLVGALLTFLLARVFGRGEDLPSIRSNPYAEQHRAQLEDREITASAVEGVAFTQSLRGYNQQEVDQYLSRITAKLEDYEQRLDGAQRQDARHGAPLAHTQPRGDK